MTSVRDRLAEQKIELPQPAQPVGNYVACVQSGNLVHVSGQVPARNGQLRYKGKLGREFGPEEGYQAARLCALNVLAQLEQACDGDFERVTRVVKLGGFVNCTAEFVDAPACINGASDLMVEVFGPDKGPHARFAVGVQSLPAGLAVEVDGLFEIRL